MRSLRDAVIAYVAVGTSQEDAQVTSYAVDRINSLTNFELLELISETIEAADAASEPEGFE